MIVVDASVVVKLLVTEDGSDRIRELVASSPLVAPELVIVEVANVMWHKAQRGALTPEHATRAIGGLANVFKQLYPDASLVTAALDIALMLNHPIYDALYLALARNLGVPLVTADRRLVAACAGTVFEPLVRPLIPLPPAPAPAPPARKRRQR